jgi:hypothetical protein
MRLGFGRHPIHHDPREEAGDYQADAAGEEERNSHHACRPYGAVHCDRERGHESAKHIEVDALHPACGPSGQRADRHRDVTVVRLKNSLDDHESGEQDRCNETGDRECDDGSSCRHGHLEGLGSTSSRPWVRAAAIVPNAESVQHHIDQQTLLADVREYASGDTRLRGIACAEQVSSPHGMLVVMVMPRSALDPMDIRRPSSDAGCDA